MYYDEDDVPILGSVSTESEINSVDSWHADLLVNSQKMSFRIDTGADVTVIPDRCFYENRLPSQNRQTPVWPRRR